ncbi:MAG: glycoside hydrolase family 3 C-terminal domain-containing protein, partial [Cyclobacteriaceae bacterium]|nr:glycoside hydrolase family 3 C-terminal domain-containing protein [Cyclobacteriaceae bacterium HetDA_MAG_MS6]
QKHLAQEIAALGKPVVVVLFNGRPVVFPWIADNMSTILEAWIPGTEAGNALADVLFGTHNPSGKLPMTFPRSIAQVPISYMEKSTGRPYKQGKNYTRYLDGPNEPAYPFGYGLSYTSFSYESISLDQNSINMKDTLAVTIQVVNEGPFDGGEVVQLYYSDLVSRVTRPMRQLVRFQKVFIPAGASQEVIFHLTSDDLRYWNDEMKFEADPGKFELYVGGNSDATKRTQFELL